MELKSLYLGQATRVWAEKMGNLLLNISNKSHVFNTRHPLGQKLPNKFLTPFLGTTLTISRVAENSAGCSMPVIVAYASSNFLFRLEVAAG